MSPDVGFSLSRLRVAASRRAVVHVAANANNAALPAPAAHPGGHFVGAGQLDDPSLVDALDREDFGQGLGRGLAVQGQDADGLAAGLGRSRGRPTSGRC